MASKSGRGALLKQKRRTGALMVSPSLLLLGVFILFPIVRSLYLSFFEWNLASNVRSYTGFGNYIEIFQDERFWNAMLRTFLYTGMYVPILLLVSLLLAVGLTRDHSYNKVLRSVFFLPAITSMAIIAIVWRFLLDSNVGLVPGWFRAIGLPVVDVLRNPSLALPAIAGVTVWRWAGFNMVILLAGLNTIPDSYYETADMDGASEIRKFFSITLPLLVPSLSFVLITNLIASFQVFDPVYVMTKGGPLFSTEVMVYHIYFKAFEVYEMGYASALAYVLFLVIIVFTLFQLRRFIRTEREMGL